MIFSSASNDFLAHHGIKGQKWGIRRFQNPDGTLTAEGKERYLAIGRKKKHLTKTKDGKYKLNNFGAEYVNRSFASLKTYKPNDYISLEMYAKAVNNHNKYKAIGVASTVAALGILGSYGAYKIYDMNEDKKYWDKKAAEKAIRSYNYDQNKEAGTWLDGKFDRKKEGYGSYKEL